MNTDNCNRNLYLPCYFVHLVSQLRDFTNTFFLLNAKCLLTDQWQNKTSRQFFLYIFLSLSNR